jgi:hypothetical protein
MQAWFPERISAVEVLSRLWSNDETDIIRFEKAEWYMEKLMALNQEVKER